MHTFTQWWIKRLTIKKLIVWSRTLCLVKSYTIFLLNPKFPKWRHSVQMPWQVFGGNSWKKWFKTRILSSCDPCMYHMGTDTLAESWILKNKWDLCRTLSLTLLHLIPFNCTALPAPNASMKWRTAIKNPAPIAGLWLHHRVGKKLSGLEIVFVKIQFLHIQIWNIKFFLQLALMW